MVHDFSVAEVLDEIPLCYFQLFQCPISRGDSITTHRHMSHTGANAHHVDLLTRLHAWCEAKRRRDVVG